jgi:hypothetical protein
MTSVRRYWKGLMAMFGAFGLSGCVAAPDPNPYYYQPGYYAYAPGYYYAPPPRSSFFFSYQDRSRHGHGHRHHRHHRHHHH